MSLSLKLPQALGLPKPLRTPKGLLILVFLAYLPLAIAGTEAGPALRTFAIACAVSVALDFVIVAVRYRRRILPDGALLTGAIIGFVLRPQEDWETVVATAAIAIVSKHALRTRWSNVLNPAALALWVSAVLFDSGQSWWGAMPDAGLAGIVLLLVGGGFIADRLNKMPMVIGFLAPYFGLFTLAAMVGSSDTVREEFRAPTLHAAIFFALFMLDDPPTSPVRYGDQIVFAAITAVSAFGLYMASQPLYFLSAALLLANLWESGRRLLLDRRRHRRPERPATA